MIVSYKTPRSLFLKPCPGPGQGTPVSHSIIKILNSLTSVNMELTIVGRTATSGTISDLNSKNKYIMSQHIILTTGIYDLIKDQVRRKRVTFAEETRLNDELKTAKQVRRRELPAEVVT